MYLISVIFLYTALVTIADGSSCSSCESTYISDKDTAPNNDVKCTLLRTYLACLETATGTGCPLSNTQSNTIATDYNSINLTCYLSDPCLCQKDFWASDLNNSSGVCRAAKASISCLRGKSGTACDGTTSVIRLAESMETTMSTSVSCDIMNRTGCKCEIDYVTSDVSNDIKFCKETKKFISCVKGLDQMMCGGIVSVPLAVGVAHDEISAIGSVCIIPTISACTCEIAYAKADIRTKDKKCSEVKKFISCLKGLTGTGCDETTSVMELAIEAEKFASNLTDCTLEDTPCGCETIYAKSNITTHTQRCMELKKYMSCLKPKRGFGCDGIKSVIDLVTEAESEAAITPTCYVDGTTCGCEVAFAKVDTNTDDDMCRETKKLISCLKARTDVGCDNNITVIQLATDAEFVISNISTCNIKATPCECELMYAKADINDTNKLCTKTKLYGGCLKGRFGPGCDGTTTVASLITTAENTLTAIPGLACNNSGVCGCEFSYAKGAIDTDERLCAETKKYISCLKSKTGTGCDVITDVTRLAAEAETTALNISDGYCSFEDTPCECETAYAKSDISNDTLLCRETKKYGGCLKTKTGSGCDGITTVASLVTAAETTLSKIVSEECMYTDNACGCEFNYAKADISTNFKKCIQTKAYINCLKDKNDMACDGKTDSAALASQAEVTIKSMPEGDCPLEDTVCSCDLAYAKTISGSSVAHCYALRNYISCLRGKTGSGCDGLSTLRTLAEITEAKLSTYSNDFCDRSPVCQCEITFVKADISSSLLLCSATKALTTCIQDSASNGCGNSVTRTDVGNFTDKVFASLGPLVCPLTDTCKCQVNFNKADVSDAGRCSAATRYGSCLETLNRTTEPGCDDITLNEKLLNDSIADIKPVFCSAADAIDMSLFRLVLWCQAITILSFLPSF